MKLKILEWSKRYFSAEIFSVFGVILFGTVTHIISHNPILTALAGTIGENLGFYGNIFYKDLQKRKIQDQKLTFIGYLKVLRDISFEFGLAEYMDLLIRPTLMYSFQRLINNTQIALLAAKFSADITFYLPAIVFYELRKRFLKD